MAIRAALDVLSRAEDPEQWAGAQTNLGDALCAQGETSTGPESLTLLAEAVGAYRAALEIRTREQLPREWAKTQAELGDALREQGVRNAGMESRALLGDAMKAYQASLEVLTRDAAPQSWAMVKKAVGTLLAAEARRSAGTDGPRLLNEAASAYREALEESGLVVGGVSPDGKLVETAEVQRHPFMVGVQFHPEFQSRPNRPHPLFSSFIGAAKQTLREGAQRPLPLETA